MRLAVCLAALAAPLLACEQTGPATSDAAHAPEDAAAPHDASLPGDATPGDGLVPPPVDMSAPSDVFARADAPEPDAATPNIEDVTAETYPRVDGSTSNLPLSRIIACELLGLPWGWYGPVQPGSNREVAACLDVPDISPDCAWVNEHIVTSGTDDAYLRLINGETDLILVASEPSPDERAHAADVGVTLDWQPVALDALVVLLNVQNPVDALSAEQIRAIYRGELTTWDQVGGQAAPIHPYVRPENSGSQQLFDSIVMEGAPHPEWPHDRVVAVMGALLDRLKGDPLSIGYSVYYFVTYQYPIDGLKLIAVDGVQPAPVTLADGTFPFIAPVFVVTRADLSHGTMAWALREWLRAPAGQAVVTLSGYVPLR